MKQSDQDYLERAFKLAFFIHPDETTAVSIARNALLKLEVTANAQFKRHYYQPSGRKGQEGSGSYRTKIMLHEQHLLQRLVYIESLPFERVQEEREEPLKHSEMVVRFIKFLVQVTLKRNSFYVVLGVARLLHEYSTKDAIELYNLILQDPERVPDDYYYRSRKKKLMAEFRERFGSLLNEVRGYRGEVRFESLESSGSSIRLVRECLKRFTPWATPCLQEEPFDPHTSDIELFQRKGEDPDGEHDVEINRIHSLVHPECFERLTRLLGMETPGQKLTIPQFNLSTRSEDDENSDRYDPPDLGDGDRDAINRFLDDQGKARKVGGRGALVLKVDGLKCAELDPVRSRSARFQVVDGVEMVEVYTADDLLLAVCLIDEFTQEAAGDCIRWQIKLEGGQEIKFVISIEHNEVSDEHKLDIIVDYRETRLARKLSLAAAVLMDRLKHPFRATGLQLLAPALALLLFFAFFRSGLVGPDPDGPRTSEPIRVELTRGLQLTLTGKSMLDIRAIYVDSLGESLFPKTLREALIARLRGGGHFTLAPVRDEADAVIKEVSDFVEEGHSQENRLNLALVNVAGETLLAITYHYEEKGEDVAVVATSILEKMEAESNK